ncbi:alanine--glyoxylate aminotransferase 2, mitochondrial isoform X3 [Onychostruthus taczanowskii]|uniref:alanine--glyoxylate aminotransferase 2, mitochondrial isoform X3 n=1 Tax=Onychostruthus taczanowskii TaxID=356909 RepID=UPI001B80E0F4|nr:alanine--glyoxylate aminotransferase 2, mitochondrial isoform X3 [Onychostruthus taczanowskii]
MAGRLRRLGGVAFMQQKWRSSVSTQAKMPPCDFVPEKYESYPYERVQEIREQNIAPSLRTYYKKPLLLHQGHMQWLFDHEGRRYLDLFAGIVTVSVGHCHPKVTMATQKQLARLWHTTNIYMYPAIHEYAEKLTSLFPDPLKVVYLTNSGSEANDLAMFMARLHTGNFDIISLRGGYHGGSPYTLGLTSLTPYKHGVANGFGCTTTMLPDVFRGPWGGSNCRDSPVQTVRKCSCTEGACLAKDQYIEQFKDTLNTSVPKTVAGFIAEPIQGVNGAVQYPRNFLKEAYQLIRERGGLCISDEQAIEEDGLQKNSEDVGTYMLLELAKLRDKFEIVGDVRGKGLMIGVEMVTDKDSRRPLPAEEINQIWEDCKDLGVLIGRGGLYSQTFRIKPPMCITKEDVDFAVEVFHTALQRHVERAAAKQN